MPDFCRCACHSYGTTPSGNTTNRPARSVPTDDRIEAVVACERCRYAHIRVFGPYQKMDPTAPTQQNWSDGSDDNGG